MKERVGEGEIVTEEKDRGCARTGLGCLVVAGAIVAWALLRLRRRDEPRLPGDGSTTNDVSLVKQLGKADQARWPEERVEEETDGLEGW